MHGVHLSAGHEARVQAQLNNRPGAGRRRSITRNWEDALVAKFTL
jgi:hypothetical protein